MNITWHLRPKFANYYLLTYIENNFTNFIILNNKSYIVSIPKCKHAESEH